MAAADEISLKGRYWNTATVNARVQSSFGAQGFAPASVLLAQLIGDVPDADEEASDLATCRLMLAAIRVSEGDLVKLAMWVQAAREDPRDLIAAAEYGSELGHAGEATRESDLAEYLEWASGLSGASPM